MHYSLQELLQTPRGVATVVLECVSYAAMLPFMYIEVRTINEYRADWLNAWNALDVVSYTLQVGDASSIESCLQNHLSYLA